MRYIHDHILQDLNLKMVLIAGIKSFIPEHTGPGKVIRQRAAAPVPPGLWPGYLKKCLNKSGATRIRVPAGPDMSSQSCHFQS
jgi:hypothetical protein